ncbi:MAG: hypothetical protein MIO90_08070 [Methanomassiliicoccales archaeon]|nr:hypothetical protein [Methanomassiliicoccales archaeon]
MNDNDWAWEMKKGCGSIRGMGWRIVFSSLSVLLWLTFLIAWLFFKADDYGIFQNIGLFIGSVVVLGVVNMLVWLGFAMSVEDISDVSYTAYRRKIAGGLIGLAWVIGAALWLFLYADDYSIYQNLAVLLLSLVPVAAFNMLLKR